MHTSINLVDEVWKSRPPAEVNDVIVHQLEFSGRSVADKLKDLREQLKQEKACGIVITTLDEVNIHPTNYLDSLKGSVTLNYRTCFFFGGREVDLFDSNFRDFVLLEHVSLCISLCRLLGCIMSVGMMSPIVLLFMHLP